MTADFDPPDPRLVKPVAWRAVPHAERGEVVEAFREGRWVVQKPWSRAVLEGLEAGDGHDALLDAVRRATGDRANEASARKALRDYLFRLWREGHVAMDFGPAPERFGARYRVRRELGRGGMGVAWLCEDAERGGDVVVKHAWGYFMPEREADRSLRAESAAMRAFDHPGIVRLHDAFEHDGRHHLVRAFADGEALVGDVPLEGRELAEVAGGLADLLAHVHERGRVLVDLQKGNFLRTGTRPVLFDLGLVHERDADGEAKFGRPAGTRGYIAPETMERSVATPRSDVFGLGRLVYHLATARLPSGRWTEADLAARLPEGRVRDLVLRLSADDPARRPPDGAAARRAILDALEAPA